MAPIHSPALLIAEDDPDDQLLYQDALREAGLSRAPHFVENGIELMDYLSGAGRDSGTSVLQHPDLIVLDLKMPRKNGWEALVEIKADPQLRDIPIVILSTSKTEEDQRRARLLGAEAYYMKPSSYRELIEIMRAVLARFEAC